MVDTVKIESIKYGNEEGIKRFLELAGDSLLKFRYFDSRPVSIIKNHRLTALAFSNNEPVGYGHLDLEDNITWLGIAVIEKGRGKGTGKKMMNFLIAYADAHSIAEICLTVDEDNEHAIHLYKKFDFQIAKHLDGGRLLMKRTHAA
ncbi:MAG: GNAT family N-acetyltransferase [Leeuwenhoekiella sp.]